MKSARRWFQAIGKAADFAHGVPQFPCQGHGPTGRVVLPQNGIPRTLSRHISRERGDSAMDFELSEEHRLIKDTARRIAKDVVAPRAKELD